MKGPRPHIAPQPLLDDEPQLVVPEPLIAAVELIAVLAFFGSFAWLLMR